jgi:TolB-like protein/tRNA A-37 threonylcarbamoyl transferase component Bud32
MEDQERLTRALADRYRVEGEIGKGGMATVYLAHDLKHDRPVAIKVLRPELAAGLGAERFVREIEISAKLTHPHILPLFDSGEADGFLYYVMPYVEGESLQDRLARQGKIPAEESIRLTDQIASALTYAHERGVIHRDIKPANILLAGGQAIVADFGIARAVEAASAEGLTGTGLAVGTPAYMSPEQAIGGEAVDARTDIYALGCVVFEMVSGGSPFQGTGPQALLAKQMADRGPSLRKTDPTIPVFLDRAVSRALATDPGERFASATAFAEALTSGTIVRRVRSRHRRRWALSGAVAALVVLGLWGLFRVVEGPRMERLAVLPLMDLTNDPEQEYLAPGVHEALIAELGRLGLSMISRASMAGYQETEKGIAEIARELNVDGVIEGSVFREGDSLEITTRLYDRNEREVWAGTFDGVLPNIVAMYRGFARAIADRIRLSLESGDEARLGEAPAVNPAVYEAYLRGMHVLHNARSPEQFDTAIAYFRQAVEQNPGDALAWAGLADGYVTLGHDLGVPDPDVWTNVRAAAERAIRLDSTSAEGWAALADYQSYWGRDWEAAEEAFRRANELNPSLAWNHYHYSWYLVLFGRVEEAVAEHERAKALDPLTPSHTTWLPAIHWASRDFERACAESQAVVAGPYPDDPIGNFVLARCTAFAGRYDEAIATYEESVPLDLNPYFFVCLGEAYALAGRGDEALRIAREVEAGLGEHFWSAEGLFCLYAALGDREEALRWLEYEPPSFSLPWAWIYPQVDALRDDPRFLAVFRRMNLAFEPGRLAPVPLPVAHPELPGLGSPTITAG